MLVVITEGGGLWSYTDEESLHFRILREEAARGTRPNFYDVWSWDEVCDAKGAGMISGEELA
jgi:hypothetical protein